MAEEMRSGEAQPGGAGTRKAVFFGAALVAAAALIWLAVSHSRAQAWNDNAITASFLNLSVRKGQRSVHLMLAYRLTNNTGETYRLPSPNSCELMRKLPNGTQEEIDSVQWDQETPVPAHGTAVEEFDVSEDPLRYDLDLEDLEAHDKLMEFASQRLARMRGLEFVDYIHHYNIELPRGWD